MTEIITDNIDLWTSALLTKSSAGRGSNGRVEAYGVKKLRELILELAVRGKLVPQDPDDEPASGLLKRIAKEKAQLFKEGEVKKEKSLPDIGDDEKPFELPTGWQWARLQEVSLYIQRGKGPQYADYGQVQVVSQKCIQWSSFDLAQARFVEDSSIQGYQKERFLRQGDLLWNSTGTGTAGRISVVPTIETNSLVADSHVTIIRPLFVNSNFLQCYIAAPGIQLRIEPGHENSLVSGTTNQVELNTSAVTSLVVPTPPLAEQHRIVAKVDELMALCDQLEQQQTNNIEAHQTLVETLLGTLTNTPVRAEPFDSVRPELVEGTNGAQDRLVEGRVASQPFTLRQAQGERGEGDGSGRTEFAEAWTRIASHFDTLFTTEQSIDQLKQTILQLAVMGKLVPQDPSDEPASVMLKRIQIKYVASLEIKDEDKLFNIPIGWAWARGEAVADFVDPHPSHRTPPEFQGGVPYVGYTDIDHKNGINFENARKIDPKVFEEHQARYQLKIGDFVFGKIGTLGEPFFLSEPFNYCLSANLILIQPKLSAINPKYLAMFLDSPIFLGVMGNQKTNSTHGVFGIKKARLICLPLPPLAEQHRIVAKVNELMTLCDALKSRLTAAQTTQIHLADTIVEQAVA